MKYIRNIIIITIFFILLISSAFADTYTDIVNDSQYNGYEREVAEILDLMKEESEEYVSLIDHKSDSLENILSSNDMALYPMYRYTGKITEESVENFSAGISDEHVWYLQKGTKETTYSKTGFSYDGTSWKWSSTTLNINYPDKHGNPMDVDFSPSGMESLMKDKSGIDSFDEIKFINVTAAYAGSYIYGRSGENEYLIPFVTRPDFLGVENGKLYTVEQAVDIFLEEIRKQEEAYKNSSGGIQIGGIDSLDETDSVPDNLILYIGVPVIVLLLISIVSIIFVKRKK